ncbi:YqaA family protein [Sedimentitalea arenosa]|jgi:membrane protein YqaA with SNARE-associated domain|uniref:DedA family protein n=1 Tax=Sedimentitalea arenosa TaxID=2798803 RepID=A0A8J7IU21_9RHOB|nr:YqaA family protein [Arenibacterium arenosum]MBJ6371352.1 DedA family protein [Arenibacterium arenosum]
MIALGGLFLSALLAATLLPAQSEAVLIALLVQGQYPVLTLLAVASAGNVLGAMINWALGRGLARFSDRPWFPVAPAQLARAERWYHRFGRYSLLLSWMPVIGDPLTVVAGLLREPAWVVLVLVTIAKTGRYVILAAATLAWI